MTVKNISSAYTNIFEGMKTFLRLKKQTNIFEGLNNFWGS